MIRSATRSDLPGIAEIHALAWHASYAHIVSTEVLQRVTPESRLDVWIKWFEEGDHEVLVFEENGEVTGFVRLCAARPVADPPLHFGEITHLYLNPKRIATGLGHKLFETAKTRLQEQGFSGMLLWTMEGNTRARSFYERHGMEHDGVRQDEPAWLGEGVFEVRYVLPFVTVQVSRKKPSFAG